MRSLSYTALVLLAVICTVSAEDKELGDDDVKVKILGKSGKIMVGRTDLVSDDPNRITVEMDSLSELDAEGKVVGATGTPKHSFNSFASQDFIFTPVTDANLQGISAKKLTFSSTLTGLTSFLSVEVYYFKDNGTLSFGGEKQEILKDQVKFSLSLRNWDWCTPQTCKKGNTGETGAFLEFTITVKSKSKPGKTTADKKDDTDDYSLGKGSIKLSKKVRTDGQWGDMIKGYPKLVNKGGKHQFVFRFNKFNTDVYYDPTIDSSAGRAVTSLVAVLCGLMAVIITW